MSIRAGRLRDRVDILRQVKVRDGSGYAISWVTIGSDVPAEVISQAGREGVFEKVFQSVRVFQITIRWRGDLLPDDQLKLDGVDLNIRSAEDRDRRRESLVIFADTEAALKTS